MPIDKSVINQRIERLEEALDFLKNSVPEIKTNADIASRLHYKRPGTISDYKNVKKYEESKFTDFVNLLSKVFGINSDYIINGKGGLTVRKLEGKTGGMVDEKKYAEPPKESGRKYRITEAGEEYLYHQLIATKNQVIDAQQAVISLRADFSEFKNSITVNLGTLQSAIVSLGETQSKTLAFLVDQFSKLEAGKPLDVKQSLSTLYSESQRQAEKVNT